MEDSITGIGYNLTGRLGAMDALQERADFFVVIGERDLKDKTRK